jgi:hypothetical protein
MIKLYAIQKLFSSRLLSKNIKITVYKTIIFPVVLHESEIWSLILREVHGLRVFGNSGSEYLNRRGMR